MTNSDLKKEMETLNQILEQQSLQGRNLTRQAIDNMRELSKKLEPYQQTNQMKSVSSYTL